MHLDLVDQVFLLTIHLPAETDTNALGMADHPHHPHEMKNQPNRAGGQGDEAACPVDHKTRETWLAQARAAEAAKAAALPAATAAASSSSSSSPQTTTPDAPPSSSSSWGWRIPFLGSGAPSSAPPPSSRTDTSPPAPAPAGGLGTDRAVSSIPRTANAAADASSASSSSASSHPAAAPSCPVNHEQETGSDAASGNWVYPSEKMFFEAMRRKGHAARARDMATVVPIHNAVNERAWAEIQAWEAPYNAPRGVCGGPRLHSFAGDSKRMSPKARINTMLGYTAPFDRHDWVVDRCGTQVEYVIDFYSGRGTGAGAQGKLNFYLDVRPKLNSWEGVKMRFLRGVGAA